ncbi:MAG: 2-oxoacid:ferredoxin oxidoreductase subunit beta [Veillonellaceae bacterium]|nr:2-oxoacid:ferredoxin oxidoreductase subunit beta [Veillonellaceae bacterium]
MAKTAEYKNAIRPNWCPGCGDFGIQMAIQEAASRRDIPFEKLALISGIGCSSRIGGYLYCYGAHTTHGRALPFAQGVKLANRDLEVVCCSGDGDAYAIGMGHTIHAIKRNINITYIVFDNHVYGLTKGQTSPRSSVGFVTNTTPHGNVETPLAVTAMAIAAGAGFVAQGYALHRAELVDLIVRGMEHKGFSFINVFTPCVTYNKYNTYDWFKENLPSLAAVEGYDASDKLQALTKLTETDGLVTGLIYEQESPSYEELSNLPEEPLARRAERMSEAEFTNLIQAFR